MGIYWTFTRCTLRAYIHCTVAISFFFCYLSMIPITNRHYNNFYIIRWVIHPTQHHQIIMYDLSLLFLLSYSFIFDVICEDSFPNYTCINQGHLVLYNVLVWVTSSLGQHLSKVLKLAPLQPSRYWLYCHYSSDPLLSSCCDKITMKSFFIIIYQKKN